MENVFQFPVSRAKILRLGWALETFDKRCITISIHVRSFIIIASLLPVIATPSLLLRNSGEKICSGTAWIRPAAFPSQLPLKRRTRRLLATFPSNSSGQLPGLWRVGVATFGSLFRAMGISRSSPRDVLTAHKDVPADGRDAVVKRAPISKRKRQDPALAKVLSPIEGTSCTARPAY